MFPNGEKQGFMVGEIHDLIILGKTSRENPSYPSMDI
jgi:hypothetical protein